MKYSKSIVFIFSVFLIFFNISIYAQNNSVKTALELSKGSKFKYVKPGRKAGIWYEGQKYKVWIDSISQNEIFTENNIFEISKIDKISIRFKGTLITGSIIGTGGLLFTGLGTFAIIKGLQGNDLGAAFTVIIGIVIDIIGIPVTAIGTSVFFIGKKYKKTKGWKFKAVQTE